jgi:prefoldin subunit 5
MSEITLTVVAAILSLLAALVQNLLTENVQDSVRRLLRLPQKKRIETYSERVSRLTQSLSKASAEVDEVLKEIAIVSQERANAVASLEKQLEELATREKQVRERIEVLEKVPLEAIQHFEKMLDKGDKRSAWRDYLLFGLGVIVSTVIAIILKLVGF